jgi:hypothetical protein
MESVASALKDAEEVLRSAVLTAASQDGFTNEIKDSLVKKLDLSVKAVESTIKMADSAAKNARKMVIDDDATLAQMEKTATKLADAIENTETITASLEGSEGGAEVDALADSLKIASDEMVNDLTAVDNIAAAVTRKIEMQAEAVIEMGQKAGQAIGTINAAKTTIEQSNSETDKAVLKTSLQESVDKIQVNENAAAELAKAITSDANTDEAAERVISDADRVFDELIDSVKETVDEVVSDYQSGEDMDDADAISDELDALQSEEEQAEKAIKSLEEAEEKVSESAVEELKGEQIKGETAKEVKTEAPEVVKEPPKEVKTEAPEVVESPKVESKSGSDPVLEKTNSEAPSPKQDVPKESSEPASDDIGTNASIDGEKAHAAERDSSASDLSHVDKIQDGSNVENVKLPEETITTPSIKVEGGESSVDSHEVMTAVSKEVTAPTSALSDTVAANESGGNAVKEIMNHIESIKAASGAENVVGDASDHIDSLKTVISSASNVVEELASKTIGAGDSLAASIDSADSPVNESLAHAVAVVSSLSFLHF